MDHAASSSFGAIVQNESVQMAVLSIVAITLLVLATLIVFQRLRRNPSERQRRLTVNERGRLGDATITDATQDTVFYCYSVRGVIYTASQDISQLQEWIQTDPSKLIGPVALKYSSRNPANSIVLCEEWSGLRVQSGSAAIQSSEPRPVTSQ